MGPGRDRNRDPWICSQTRICCQTRYRLRYAARYCAPLCITSLMSHVMKKMLCTIQNKSPIFIVEVHFCHYCRCYYLSHRRAARAQSERMLFYLQNMKIGWNYTPPPQKKKKKKTKGGGHIVFGADPVGCSSGVSVNISKALFPCLIAEPGIGLLTKLA